MGRVILWDFDGTLAVRPGLWSQAMVDVLDRRRPGHGLTRDDFRPALRDGFPWHRPERPHAHLIEPAAWWQQVNGLLRGGFAAAGYLAEADELVDDFREVFLDPRSWTVYDDTEPALAELAEAGWRHAIVSNHVPELPELVSALGLGGYFDAVITSARVGYEKPHPEIFRYALAAVDGGPAVMVGDNPVADVEGATGCGLQAFLVRRRTQHHRCFDDLVTLSAELLKGRL